MFVGLYGWTGTLRFKMWFPNYSVIFIVCMCLYHFGFLSDIDILNDLGVCFRDTACTVAIEDALNWVGPYPITGKQTCFENGGRAWGIHGSNETCHAQEYLGQFSAEAISK